MRTRLDFPFRRGKLPDSNAVRLRQVHHVLGEIIQGGLVLETNINEISTCGQSYPPGLPALEP